MLYCTDRIAPLNKFVHFGSPKQTSRQSTLARLVCFVNDLCIHCTSAMSVPFVDFSLYHSHFGKQAQPQGSRVAELIEMLGMWERGISGAQSFSIMVVW